MNINTSPDQIVRSTAQLTPGYMSGFGNSFETEALPGALPSPDPEKAEKPQARARGDRRGDGHDHENGVEARVEQTG